MSTTATDTKTPSKPTAGGDKPADAPIVPVQPEDTESTHSAPQSEAGTESARAPAPAETEAAPAPAIENRHGQELSKREDARSRAAKRFQELRAKERAEKEGKAPAGKEEAGEPGKGGAEPEHQPTRKAEPVREQPAGEASQEFAYKVDGEEGRVSLKELIDNYQINKAAKKREDATAQAAKRLDESKRVLKDALKAVTPKSTVQSPAPHAPENPPGTAPRERAHEPGEESQHQASSEAQPQPEHPPRRTSRLDKEKLRQVAERIQVGDTDEGAAALQEIVEAAVEEVQSRTANPDTIRRQTRAEIVQASIEAENGAALKRFAERYPELAGDSRRTRLLAEAGRTALREELARDLLELGLSEAEIAPFRANEGTLMYVRNNARANGLPVRDPDELLDAVGKTLVEEFKIQAARPAAPSSQSDEPVSTPARRASEPAQDPALQARLDAKRAHAQQPRTAGVRAPAPQAPRPRTKEQYVQDLRRQRGFSTTA